ncbi:kinase-like domain-containing protein [Zopfochytrium polystomum]|nr:kinase-like domain-containing protein [Zopfochytrium polystomum]
MSKHKKRRHRRSGSGSSKPPPRAPKAARRQPPPQPAASSSSSSSSSARAVVVVDPVDPVDPLPPSPPEKCKEPQRPAALASSLAADVLPQLTLSEIKCDTTAVPLGEGGFGKVFRATYGNSQVAIKFIKDNGRLLLEEAKVMMRTLAHGVQPYVIQLHGVMMKERCLVMELATKGSLKKYIEQNDPTKVPIRTRVIYLKHVALGMRDLHQLKINHNDLTSSNVLLTESSLGEIVAKISDFGLSRDGALSGNTSSSQLGALYWMAPERNRGEITHKSDVFSFAPLLTEVVPWFKGVYGILFKKLKHTVFIPEICKDNRFRDQVVRNFKTECFENATDVNFGAGLAKLFEECWAADPRNRPEFKDIVKVLEELLDAGEAAVEHRSSGAGNLASPTGSIIEETGGSPWVEPLDLFALGVAGAAAAASLTSSNMRGMTPYRMDVDEESNPEAMSGIDEVRPDTTSNNLSSPASTIVLDTVVHPHAPLFPFQRTLPIQTVTTYFQTNPTAIKAREQLQASTQTLLEIMDPAGVGVKRLVEEGAKAWGDDETKRQVGEVSVGIGGVGEEEGGEQRSRLLSPQSVEEGAQGDGTL